MKHSIITTMYCTGRSRNALVEDLYSARRTSLEAVYRTHAGCRGLLTRNLFRGEGCFSPSFRSFSFTSLLFLSLLTAKWPLTSSSLRGRCQLPPTCAAIRHVSAIFIEPRELSDVNLVVSYIYMNELYATL